MKDLNNILGVIDFDVKEEIPAEIKGLIEEREKARKKKDWKKADKIREELRKKGIELMDTPDGVRCKRF